MIHYPPVALGGRDERRAFTDRRRRAGAARPDASPTRHGPYEPAERSLMVLYSPRATRARCPRALNGIARRTPGRTGHGLRLPTLVGRSVSRPAGQPRLAPGRIENEPSVRGLTLALRAGQNERKEGVMPTTWGVPRRSPIQGLGPGVPLSRPGPRSQVTRHRGRDSKRDSASRTRPSISPWHTHRPLAAHRGQKKKAPGHRAGRTRPIIRPHAAGPAGLGLGLGLELHRGCGGWHAEPTHTGRRST
ncbi:hypothetical protein L1887_56925 [Cichorium endivia]|nr:hypothetical protein L1887_56919 [Cichorium endivia]KAI3480919.1 hypothetical protein L1887_56925 [Cichorium endivia]